MNRASRCASEPGVDCSAGPGWAPAPDPLGRRDFLRRSLLGVALAGGLLPNSVRAISPGPVRRLELPATLQARSFGSASGEDAGYHALVYEGGGAAAKALLTTPVSDLEVARRLRELGARDGGGVPMAAWNLRHLPLVRAPDTRVVGTPVRIRAAWEEWESPRDLSDLLGDSGGRGVALRFGGNEEHDPLWDSGCIACLFSCPGGVVSNERYTIRDHVRGVTRFVPAADLPEADVPVTIMIELLA